MTAIIFKLPSRGIARINPRIRPESRGIVLGENFIGEGLREKLQSFHCH